MRCNVCSKLWVALFLLLPGLSVSPLLASNSPVTEATSTFAEVTGTITDDSGSPLIGATVRVKDSPQGTLTDGEGRFTLNVPDGATTLVVSYIGYETQEIDITGRSTVNIIMAGAASFLDEVVVTGYGTLKGKEVTGSITSVKAEDFNNGNINDAAQLLQGKVSGLTITRPGANPNGNFKIRLRGLSTVGTSQEPLVVIDGVPGGNLNSVEPQDIASIDVLKDGSAAAIYGTRGASGVILITTKKGVAGTSSVNYNGQVTFETVDRVVDVLTADEYRAFPGSNDLGGNVDWFDEIMETGVSHIHNLSLSGGSSNTTWRISANYRNVNGIARTTGFERINGRVSLTQRALDDKLKLAVNLATTTEDASLGFEEAFRYATIFNPTAPFVQNTGNADFDIYDGYFQQVLFDFYNPVAIIEQNRNERQTKTLIANIRGDYNITDDLKFGLFYSQQRTNADAGAYFDKQSFWVGQNRNGLARRTNDEAQDQLIRAELNYETLLGGNTSLKAIAAYEYQDFAFNGFRAEGGDFLTDAFSFNNLGGAADFANGLGSVGSYKNTFKLIAGFVRVNLNVDDKFYATASVRREGSSRFGEDRKYGNFPALSAGIDFVNAIGMGGFDLLKLRAGYGETGGNAPESYLSLRRFGPTGSSFFFNGTFVPAFGPVSNPNANLGWERKQDFNVGVDFAMMNYKLTGSLEYYTTSTKDLLQPFNVPVPPNFFPTTWLNIGELRNSGIEATINYEIDLGAEKSLSLGLIANRFFDSELVSLLDSETGIGDSRRELANLGSPGQNGTSTILLEQGKPIGQIWTLRSDPNKRVNDDGTWNFLDVDGDGVQDDILDRDIVGNGLPKYQLGLNAGLNLGNLDINVFFRGVFGHDLLNTFRAFYEAPSTINAYNILATSAEEVAGLTDQPQLNDFHVESADFLKLDNLTVGYSLPSIGGGFKSARIFFNGQNLLTITGYSGVSPEPRLDDGGNPLAPGLDRRNTYFSARSFTFGLNLGF